ncbi:unnamed protein product [Urochloa humidicola]
MGCGGARRCGCLARTPAPARAARRRATHGRPRFPATRAPDDGSTAPVDLTIMVSCLWSCSAPHSLPLFSLSLVRLDRRKSSAAAGAHDLGDLLEQQSCLLRSSSMPALRSPWGWSSRLRWSHAEIFGPECFRASHRCRRILRSSQQHPYFCFLDSPSSVGEGLRWTTGTRCALGCRWACVVRWLSSYLVVSHSLRASLHTKLLPGNFLSPELLDWKCFSELLGFCCAVSLMF